ncbi:MAG TPA: dethiobiotin synthase [Solirubrobacteraceae bacterium]|jgi:dethiobiotin synthetase|nr:dethiobiotin synthase [Solirubrobacteraceae bacterium]
MRGLFVTGTGTGVGKTMVSAALLAAMSEAGVRVRAHKPIVTGLDEPSETEWPPDHELLARVAGMSPEEVAPLRYGPAVSPHLAAALMGEAIDPADLIARARAAGTGANPGEGILIVEGVGGLLVPLAEEFTVRDLAAALGLPVVIAASPGLGTINHTLLSVESARSAGLDVCAVVLTPWAEAPGELELSNRETISRLGEIEVLSIGDVPTPAAADFARAGGALPWRRWCPPESFIPSDS